MMRRLGPLFAVLCLLLSACAATPAGPVGPTFSGEPIRVGLLHSLSGTLALSEVPVRNAALLAIDEINAAGGVLGRKLEWVVADGESDPEVFAREARRLIVDEQVATIFGCWTSASRKAVLPVVEETNSLLWYPVQYEGLEQSPNIMYLGATTNQQIIPAVEYLVGEGKQRFFLLGSDYVFPRTANAIVRAQLDDLGISIVGEEYVPLGEQRFEALIATIQASGADVVLNTLNGDSNVAFFQQLSAAGLDAAQLPTLSVSIAEPEVRAIGGEFMTGHLTAWNYFQTVETEANAAFITAYRARYGEQQAISDPMEAMYIGVYLWAMAVEQAGSLDVDAVRAAAQGLQIDAPEGPVTLDGATQHLVKIVRIGRIAADGRIEEIQRSDAPVIPDPFLLSYPWAEQFHR